MGLLLVSLLFLFSNIGARKTLIREYVSEKDDLLKENEILIQKANKALEDKKRLDDRVSLMQKELDRVSEQKNEIQKKYDQVVKEREELIERLKQRKPEAKAAVSAETFDDAYWSRVLKEKAGLETQVEKLKDEISNLKLLVEEAKRDRATMELEVRSLNREKQDLDSRINYNEEVTDSLSSELVREKKDKRQLINELRTLKNEHIALLRQLKRLSDQRTSLEVRLKDAEQAKEALNKRITDMNTILDYKLSQVMDVKKDLQQLQEGQEVKSLTSEGSIELPPIIVRSLASETPAVKYRGKVLAVNKENNFVIIDLGEQEDLKNGDIFDIYRNDVKIATVQVIQTRKNVSACDIKQASGPISVGDEVK